MHDETCARKKPKHGFVLIPQVDLDLFFHVRLTEGSLLTQYIILSKK